MAAVSQNSNRNCPCFTNCQVATFRWWPSEDLHTEHSRYLYDDCTSSFNDKSQMWIVGGFEETIYQWIIHKWRHIDLGFFTTFPPMSCSYALCNCVTIALVPPYPTQKNSSKMDLQDQAKISANWPWIWNMFRLWTGGLCSDPSLVLDNVWWCSYIEWCNCPSPSLIKLPKEVFAILVTRNLSNFHICQSCYTSLTLKSQINVVFIYFFPFTLKI